MRALVLITLLLSGIWANAQGLFLLKPENADCENAIEIYFNEYGPTTPPKGYGDLMEISGEPLDPYSFEEEHNTVWYKFTADSSCFLDLEISPLKVSDDYDFILYEYKGEETCKLIKERQLLPVRSCISRNDTSVQGKTGLSMNATDTFIHSGPGASFAKSLAVTEGQQYLLVLDNVYPNGDGHNLKISYNNCKKKEEVKVEEPSNYLNINVKNPSTNELVPATIIITNKSGYRDSNNVETFESVSSLFIKAEQQTTYIILAKADGYFQSKKMVKTGTDFQTYLMTLELLPIVEGEKISFSDIYFQAGTDRILRDSYDVLDDIVATLLDQPDIELQIIGHVNEPYNQKRKQSKTYLMKLSEDRAKAVVKYLTKKGIDPSRLSFEGKSNHEMVYPYARTEDQKQMNRRVEFLIKKS